jgi:hypothetical protein
MSLFDAPGPGRHPKTQHRPEWIRYRPVVPVKCDDCVLRLADNNGDAPPAADARYRRRFHAINTYYCAPHARTRRSADRGGTPE